MSERYLLGLDLGTSGVKALLYPLDGTQPHAYTAELALSTPRAGWSEQNPDDWWRATVEAVYAVVDRSGANAGEIAAVATSGQMHGATLLDARGEVLRPCILWNDQRSGAECISITEQVGAQQLLQWTGNPALAGFTAPKLLWVRRHEPEVYERLATVLLPKDYLNYRMTGELATEVSDASGTLLFDVARRQWSKPTARALDIPLSFLPPVHESTGIVGQITGQAARETGLREGTPVVAGGADNACAAVGMGVVREGQVLASIGTSGTLLAPSDAPSIDLEGRLHTFCHAVPDCWYVMGVVLSAGGSLRWYRDTIADTANGETDRDPYERIMEEAETVPAGCEGLFFLPYLTGERTPHGDPAARGAYVGLTLRHTRAHLARSVIEGVTFALADSAELMRNLGTELRSIRVTGGGARSALWRQILADTLNAQVLTTYLDMGPAFGAAIIAGVGSGVYASIPEATQTLVAISSQTDPDEQRVRCYRNYHAVYDRLYPALQDVFREIAVLDEPV